MSLEPFGQYQLVQRVMGARAEQLRPQIIQSCDKAIKGTCLKVKQLMRYVLHLEKNVRLLSLILCISLKRAFLRLLINLLDKDSNLAEAPLKFINFLLSDTQLPVTAADARDLPQDSSGPCLNRD
jgi:hypothetical protein